MADEKLNTGSGEEKLPEAPAPVAADEPQAPAPEQTAAPTPQPVSYTHLDVYKRQAIE